MILNILPSVFSFVFTLLLISMLLSLALAVYTLKIKENKTAFLFGLIMIFSFLWSLLKMACLFIVSPKIREILHLVNMLLILPIPGLFFINAVYYTKYPKWFKSKHILFLFLIPAILTILILTSNYHQLLFHDFTIKIEHSIPMHFYKMNVGYYLFNLYIYIFMISSILILVKSIINKDIYFRRQMLLFIIGGIIPLIYDAFFTIGISPLRNYNLACVFISFGNCFFAMSLFGYRFYKLVPVTRNLVIEKMPDIMIVTNPEHLIIDINNSGKSFFDLNKVNIIGGSFYDIFKIYPNLIKKYSENDNKPNEITIQKYNQIYYFSISVSKVESGEVLLANIIILHSITERKKAELKIQQQNDELTELNATKDKFFSIIAHDLKNPFNSIIGLSSLLVNQFDSFEKEKIKELLVHIDTTANQTFQLLENLLEWSKIQQGKLIPALKKHNLKNITSEIEQLLLEFANNKNIKIENKINSDISIFCDTDMTKTILRNLISNAIKFTQSNGIVAINAFQKIQNIEIQIKDTGVGIPTDTLPHLFSIEKNTTTKGTSNETGTGLGLLLCKELVEKQGGQIWVESKVGEGSVFYFTLQRIFS